MTINPFVEQQFPPQISAGVRGGIGFNTTVNEYSSGAEKRSSNWARERPRYDVSTGLRDASDFRAFQKFFVARRGKAIGFRFKDWSDYQLPFWKTTPGDTDALPTLFTTDGTTTSFQLVKVYSDAGGSFSRKIVKPVVGTVALFNNASAMTNPTNFTVDHTTGIVTLSTAIRSTTGRAITGHCEFDVPVRFDTDDMNATLNGNDIVIWDAIPIVGLKF